MILRLSAPILAGAQFQGCHTGAHGVKLSRSLEFPGSFSSSLCIRRASRPTPGWGKTARRRSCSMPAVKAIGDPSQSTFLSLEEAGLIEMTNLDMHEKFLARLTILNHTCTFLPSNLCSTSTKGFMKETRNKEKNHYSRSIYGEENISVFFEPAERNFRARGYTNRTTECWNAV